MEPSYSTYTKLLVTNIYVYIHITTIAKLNNDIHPRSLEVNIFHTKNSPKQINFRRMRFS